MSFSIASLISLMLVAQPAAPQPATGQVLSATPEEAELIFSASSLVQIDRVSDLRLSHTWSTYGRPEPRYLYGPNGLALKRTGFDALDAFVHWSEVEPLARRFDQQFYISDAAIELATRTGLAPSVTLVAAPHISVPEWFRNGPQATFFSSLEHNRNTTTLSLWNPVLTGHYQRLVRGVCERYGDDLENLVLAPSGSYGETAYPSGGGLHLSPNFYQGRRWWCAQPEAREAFRKWLLERHGSLEAVSKAWAGDIRDATAIATAPHNYICLPAEDGYEQYFRDAAGLPPFMQNRFRDFSTWYARAMERHAEFWLQRARQYRKQGRVTLALAGDGHPQTGADLPRLVHLASQYHADVRYAPPGHLPGRIFALAGPVVSAARHYGVELELDATGASVPQGLRSFLWLATAAPSRTLVSDAVFGSKDPRAIDGARFAIELIREHLTSVPTGEPRIEVALLMPESRLALDHRRLLAWQGFAARLRDVVDLEIFSESLVRDDALASVRFLVSPPEALPDPETSAKIEAFVEAGGVWIAPTESLPEPFRDRLAQDPNNPVAGVGEGYVAEVDARPGRLVREVARVLQTQDLWPPLQWPSWQIDDVFVTVREDDSLLLFNTGQRAASVTIAGATQPVHLDAQALRVLGSKK